MNRSIFGATFLVAGMLAATAVAHWSGPGGGMASQRMVNVQALTFVPVVASAHLRPGASGGLAVTVENPNPFEVRLESLELDTDVGANGFEVDAAHASCDVSALAFEGADNAGTGWSIPPRSGSDVGLRMLRIVDAVTMDIDAEQACQGASFAVHVRAGS